MHGITCEFLNVGFIFQLSYTYLDTGWWTGGGNQPWISWPGDVSSFQWSADRSLPPASTLEEGFEVQQTNRNNWQDLNITRIISDDWWCEGVTEFMIITTSTKWEWWDATVKCVSILSLDAESAPHVARRRLEGNMGGVLESWLLPEITKNLHLVLTWLECFKFQENQNSSFLGFSVKPGKDRLLTNYSSASDRL